jgi:hypothetical protein
MPSHLPRNEVFEFMTPLKVECHLSAKSRRDTLSSADVTSISDSCSFSGMGRVRFDLDNIFQVRKLGGMSSEERRAVWHNQDSFNIINGANNITVQLMMIGRENPEQFGHCFRGLENRLPASRKLFDERINLATNAVLREQEQQRSEGISNPSCLRRVYRKHTLASIEIAMGAAEVDAHEAAAYQKEYASPTPLNSTSTNRYATAVAWVDEENASINIVKVRATDDDDVSILSNDCDCKGFLTHQTESKGMMYRIKQFAKDRRSRRASAVVGW